MEGIATLSSKGDITSFAFGDSIIRFKTSPALERYTAVKQWDAGYLVVDAQYNGLSQSVEEYIDLVPVLQNLYRDAHAFCAPIKEVCIVY